MKKRITIYADNGMVLTNGKEYGKVLHLANDVSESDYYEITEDEYEAIMAEEEQAWSESQIGSVAEDIIEVEQDNLTTE